MRWDENNTEHEGKSSENNVFKFKVNIIHMNKDKYTYKSSHTQNTQNVTCEWRDYANDMPFEYCEGKRDDEVTSSADIIYPHSVDAVQKCRIFQWGSESELNRLIGQ